MVQVKRMDLLAEATKMVETAKAEEAKNGGEPVTNQAPAPSTTSTTSTTSTVTVDKSIAESTAPSDYLKGGYYHGTGRGRYMAPDLVGETAVQIAQALGEGGLKLNSYNSILRELKRANKKSLPVAAKVGALAGSIAKAKILEQRKRAPHLLIAVLEKNRREVENTAEADAYDAAYRHLEAIGAYLGDYQE